MAAIKAYFEAVREILARAEGTQAEAMEQAAAALAGAIERKNAVFAFGSNHAGLLALELFYRTGGLAVVNPVRMPGLCLDVDPPTLTTDMERMEGYGAAIVKALPLREGDVFILHSVSGRNAVPIDVALGARERGVKTICLTGMATSSALPSRHTSGKRLFEVCDIVLDNCGHYGDAALELGGFPERVAPTSTAVGAAMLNAVAARAVELLLENGQTPPVFMSSNVPGGDAHNARIMEAYRDSIFYL